MTVGSAMSWAVARVDDVPAPERLAAAQREVADGGIDRTERLDERRRQVRAPAVRERHPSLRQVHGVERVGPPVVGAEAHPRERADTGLGVDEVEVVALAPRGVVADRVEQLVGRVGSGGHRSGVCDRRHEPSGPITPRLVVGSSTAARTQPGDRLRGGDDDRQAVRAPEVVELLEGARLVDRGEHAHTVNSVDRIVVGDRLATQHGDDPRRQIVGQAEPSPPRRCRPRDAASTAGARQACRWTRRWRRPVARTARSRGRPRPVPGEPTRSRHARCRTCNCLNGRRRRLPRCTRPGSRRGAAGSPGRWRMSRMARPGRRARMGRLPIGVARRRGRRITACVGVVVARAPKAVETLSAFPFGSATQLATGRAHRPGVERRAAARLPRSRRPLEPRRQRHRGRRPRAGPEGRPRRRPRARQGRAGRPAARGADDGQGELQHPRPADDVGLPRVRRQHRVAGRRGRRPAAGCGRGDLREDERPDVARRLPVLQRRLRHDEQPVGPDPRRRRVVGRLGSRPGGGPDGPRVRQRHRRQHPQPRRLQRRVRPQADVRHRAQAGPDVERTARRARARSRSSDRWRVLPRTSRSPSRSRPAPTSRTGTGSRCRRRRDRWPAGASPSGSTSRTSRRSTTRHDVDRGRRPRPREGRGDDRRARPPEDRRRRGPRHLPAAAAGDDERPRPRLRPAARARRRARGPTTTATTPGTCASRRPGTGSSSSPPRPATSTAGRGGRSSRTTTSCSPRSPRRRRSPTTTPPRCRRAR